MGATKHEKSFVDFDKPYEQNVIGLKGVIYFGGGLFVLIVITFGLMWAFLLVLEDNEKENKASTNPMIMTEKERLPPEPRLQGAPGFGVESRVGRVNMELQEPQSEYRELRDQWEEIWQNGQKDPGTGIAVSMSIDEAKKRFLEQGVKARSGAEAEKVLMESRMRISDSSAGRVASETRR